MTTAPGAPPAATPAELLYPDLDQELATTRRMLERVPDGHNDWRPHAKSMSLGTLATHLAELPRLAVMLFDGDELDWAAKPYVPTPPGTTAERVASFDRLAAEMRAAVTSADWAALERRWVMRAGDQVFVDERKRILVRTLGLSHMAHHRAQLGVYLRQLEVGIPGCYGPSGDES